MVCLQNMQVEWQTVQTLISSDPDQRSSLIWVYIICPDLYVWEFRIITVYLVSNGELVYIFPEIPEDAIDESDNENDHEDTKHRDRRVSSKSNHMVVKQHAGQQAKYWSTSHK